MDRDSASRPAFGGHIVFPLQLREAVGRALATRLRSLYRVRTVLLLQCLEGRMGSQSYRLTCHIWLFLSRGQSLTLTSRGNPVKL